MKEIVKKHVLLSMSNGHVLEGFVDDLGDTHLTLIESNNQTVIVKVNDISFVRLGSITEQQPQMYRPVIQQEEEPYRPPPNPQATEEDFSMSLPTAADNPYIRQPELVRNKRSTR